MRWATCFALFLCLGLGVVRQAPVAKAGDVKVKPGRTITLPVVVQAFEYEAVFAGVSGFLRNVKVDIGDRVKQGDVLAEIDAPELGQDERSAAAKVEKAKADVKHVEAQVAATHAELDAAKALLKQREAEKIRALANVKFHDMRYKRYADLLKKALVDESLVDEHLIQLEAAKSARDAGDAAINTAEGDIVAKRARLAQAEAQLLGAQARVKVAEAALRKATIFVDMTRIRSHYDGVVTKRSYHNGDFVRRGDKADQTPLFRIERVDQMRVIVQVPDNVASYVDSGNTADLIIPNLREAKIGRFKVSRIALSRDEKTGTMRVEIDVPNANGVLRSGMRGEVVIQLSK